MKVCVREYAEIDRPYIIKCMEGLQDHLILIDPMQRLRRLSEYGVSYTNRLVDKVINKYRR